MAAEPNHVGSPHDKANAEWLLAQFKDWGWDAHIETFEVLYPTPISETLEMLGAQALQGDAAGAADPRRHQRHRQAICRCPPMSPTRATAMSPRRWSMSITACLDDYKRLEQLGISVKGKIVIARYGEGWRGLKPKLAQEHGAVGCLIYSDPADDGYSTGLPSIPRARRGRRTASSAARSPT